MHHDEFVTIGGLPIQPAGTCARLAPAERDWVTRVLLIPIGVLLAVVMLAAAEAFIWSMPALPNQAPDMDFYSYARSILAGLLSLWVVAVGARHAVAGQADPSLRQVLIAGAALAVLLCVLILFLVSPEVFGRIGLEDGVVEWASAILPVAASVLLLLQFARARKRDWTGPALIACAALLFTLGMEEISWMQRVFGFATPDALSGNIQREFNFHNLATNQIGVLHKIAGFAFLVFLPFVFRSAPSRVRASPLAALVPGRGVALASAPLAALNYNGWDFLPMQMTTWITLGILFCFARWAWQRQQAAEAVIASAMMALIAGAQALFLALGDRFIRIWDVTEYKELFIAFGLFIWAMEIFRKREPR